MTTCVKVLILTSTVNFAPKSTFKGYFKIYQDVRSVTVNVLCCYVAGNFSNSVGFHYFEVT